MTTLTMRFAPQAPHGGPGWGIGPYLAKLAKHWTLWRAECALELLDDQMLKDLGIHRTEIGRVVRNGRGR
jgi:uncharacterized protein YjiS (DUF1127 family)